MNPEQMAKKMIESQDHADSVQQAKQMIEEGYDLNGISFLYGRLITGEALMAAGLKEFRMLGTNSIATKIKD